MAVLLGWFLAVESLDRAALLVWSGVTGAGIERGILPLIFYGLLEDLGVGLALGVPVLGALFLRRRWLRSRIGAVLAHIVLFLMAAALSFNEAAELLFWNEFDSRFNSIAVNYLIFPREVIGNIRESFSLGILIPAVLAGAVVLYLLLRGSLARALAAPSVPWERRQAVLLASGSAAVAAVLLVADLPSRYQNRELAEIAANGLHSLIRAAVTNDEKFDGLYLTLPEREAQERARRLSRLDGGDPAGLSRDAPRHGLWRRMENPGPAKKLNIVLVLEESFGTTYMDELDNARGESISPNLTALSRQGVFFTNIYATGNRTVRGLEATLMSFPPIPGVSTTRRAGSQGMNSLPFFLRAQGYHTAFLYGGRATFDNMRNFWSGIGFEKVWDDRDIADPGFKTVWGVADQYLFAEALKRMDENAGQDGPFFLGLLTVSNHRPYVYPDGTIDKPSQRKRKENAATYADWAFGDFVRRASTRAWFKDTVFVFIGDHGPRVYGAATVPVPSYRVPLLFYAPAHLAPQRIDTLGSSIDLTPTLLGLLGFSYDSPFFGVDLTRVPRDGGRVVMEHNYAIGMGAGGRVAAIMPGQRTQGYTMKPGPYDLVPVPEADLELVKDTVALTQVAHRLFYGRRYHELAEKTGR
ncbi:MAG: hypothetical protein FJX42_04850 [Alphaproteobacteria bacterium]|nr:hypothetical protein [Alphaproteobacteria bacterium]